MWEGGGVEMKGGGDGDGKEKDCMDRVMENTKYEEKGWGKSDRWGENSIGEEGWGRGGGLEGRRGGKDGNMGTSCKKCVCGERRTGMEG